MLTLLKIWLLDKSIEWSSTVFQNKIILAYRCIFQLVVIFPKLIKTCSIEKSLEIFKHCFIIQAKSFQYSQKTLVSICTDCIYFWSMKNCNGNFFLWYPIFSITKTEQFLLAWVLYSWSRLCLINFTFACMVLWYATIELWYHTILFSKNICD